MLVRSRRADHRHDREAVARETVKMDIDPRLVFPLSERVLTEFTPGQRLVLRWLAVGFSQKQIAQELGRPLGTVKNFIRHARRRAGFGTTSDLRAYLIIRSYERNAYDSG